MEQRPASDLTLTRAAHRWRRDRDAARSSRSELAALVLEAVRSGMSISAVAAVTGLERIEVRRMIGDQAE